MKAVNEIGEPLRAARASAAVPPGCKGAACPFFVSCQGRCATRQTAQRIAPDGGVWIETR
jgi:hypothetical protein